MDLRKILKQMVDAKASDIFFVAGLPVTYNAGGRQLRTKTGPLSPMQTRTVVAEVYAAANRDFQMFLDNGNHDDDFSFAIPGIGRFRANAFRQRGSLGLIIRIIPFGLPNPVEFEIPEEVLRFADVQKGLVLVTGPAGVGKSTTLACIIDRLNHSRQAHVITMEDPIEYLHSHGTCIVTQREIPTDVATYAEALRSAMRESPDVILLGEMRDVETIGTAVAAAEMSQLLFSTLHTTGAAGTVDRIIDTFPSSQHKQVRIQLSMALQAIVSQQLIPTVDGGVTPAFEIMCVNTAIRNMIREAKTHQIDSVIASSAAEGMRTMDQSLFDLYKKGRITREMALQYSVHTEALKKRIESEE